MTWGARIEAGSVGYPIAGQPPAWLANERGPIRWYKPEGSAERQQILHSARNHNFGSYRYDDSKASETTAFELPADHWAYGPIKAGLTPWAGGPKAPSDCEVNKPIMFRGGAIYDNARLVRWQHICVSSDIIGYTRKSIVSARPVPAYEMEDTLQRIKQSATTLLEALATRTGVTVIPLDDTLGIITQIDNLTTGLAVRDDVIHECYQTAMSAERCDLIPSALRAMLPPDPIEQAVDEYIAATAPDMPHDRAAIASVIKWIELRNGNA